MTQLLSRFYSEPFAQAKLYCDETRTSFSPVQPNRQYQLSSKLYYDVRVLDTQLPISGDHYVELTTKAFPRDKPFAVRLDQSIPLKEILRFNESSIVLLSGVLEVPLTQKIEHVCFGLNSNVIFSELCLKLIHKHLAYLCTDKLLPILRRANAFSITLDTHFALGRIQKKWDECQHERSDRNPFCVALPDRECIFNRIIAKDLTKIKACTFLYTVDNDNRLSKAGNQTEISTCERWIKMTIIAFHQYLRHPDSISYEQAPQFIHGERKDHFKINGIVYRPSGAEGHDSLRAKER